MLLCLNVACGTFTSVVCQGMSAQTGDSPHEIHLAGSSCVQHHRYKCKDAVHQPSDHYKTAQPVLHLHA